MKDPRDDKTMDMHAPEPPKRRGRPAIYADAAAKQRAYRARKRQEGRREVKAWVRDVRDDSKPLTSDIIDLSEVRQRR